METIIETARGRRRASYVKHLRTLTASEGGGGNVDVDLYRLTDGRLVVCRCDPGDCRVPPRATDDDPAIYGVRE